MVHGWSESCVAKTLATRIICIELDMNADMFREVVKSLDNDAVDRRVRVIAQLMFKGTKKHKKILGVLNPLW